MARTRSFTDDEILHAVKQLQGNGRAVNPASIAKAMGKGRPSAIAKVLEELSSDGKLDNMPMVKEDAPLVQSFELPPEVSERVQVLLSDLQSAVETINNVAHNTAEKRLNNAIKEANKRAAEAAKAQAESVQEQTDALERLEDARDELADLEEAIEALKEDLRKERSKAEILTAENKKQEKALVELHNRLAETDHQLEQAQKDASQTRGEIKSVNQLCDSLKTELKQFTEQNNALTKENKSLDKDNAKLQANLDAAGNNLAILTDSDTRLKQQLTEKGVLLDEQKELRIKAESQTQSLLEQNKALSAQLDTLQEQLLKLASDNAEKTNR